MSDASTAVLQFGTSRFLQAHADLFFSEADPPCAVTIVQSSGDPSRAHRLAALADPAGFPVRIRGLMKQRIVDEVRCVRSVHRTLSTETQWNEVVDVFCEEAQIVISNTGDSGYDARPADTLNGMPQDMSYPGKLFQLLACRFQRNGTALTIMPMELINDNGQILKARIAEIGRLSGADSALLDWIDTLPFANSLVDRIVSESIEPAGAVAEPYALWAIEAAQGVSAPCKHPAVQRVPDIQQIERLKLHILNLGHTILAHQWQSNQLPADLFVRQIMEQSSRAVLDDIYAEEVLPGFAAMGLEEEARDYHASTIERFCNPFLDHKLADIAQNHSQKIERRITAFLDWTRDTGLAMPRLRALHNGSSR